MKRQESSVSPKLQHLPSGQKSTSPLPSTLSLMKYEVLPNILTLEHNGVHVRRISISRKMSTPKSIFSVHFGQNLFRGCAGEEVRGGKTDSGMKHRVRGNWISSILHTTGLHTRLTGAHAKDALTLAKILFFKGQTSECYLSLSMSVHLSVILEAYQLCSFSALQ